MSLPSQPPYLYRATVLNVVDGDTVDMEIDAGFHATITTRFRLFGINAPERKGETKQAGDEARDALLTMIPVGSEVLVKTHKGQDKYGRWLAEIQMLDGSTTVNEKMVREKFAVRYMV